METFARLFSDKYGIGFDTTIEFLDCFKCIDVDRSECIVEKGRFNDKFYVLKEGLLRAYIPHDGYEQSLWFGFPGQVIFDVWCYHYGRQSSISIEAVTPSTLYVISKPDLEKLCNDRLDISNLVRKIFIGHAAETEESFTRLVECDGGLERYLSVLQRHPELLQKVPLNKLASYIQLAPQSLSRIRAKIK